MDIEGYSKSRGFTETDRKVVATYQLQAMNKNDKFSQARGEMNYDGNLTDATAELQRIENSGKQGKLDLSHKLSHNNAQTIFGEIKKNKEFKKGQKRAFTAFLKAGEKKATTPAHKKSIGDALTAVKKRGRLADDEFKKIGKGFHSAVNHSSANLRHRAAGENRSFGRDLHANFMKNRDATPDFRAAMELEKVFKIESRSKKI